MLKFITNIYSQTKVTLESSPAKPEGDQAKPGFTTVIRNDSGLANAITISEERIFTAWASSADIIEQSGQTQEYVELGEVLSEMVGLEEDDEWKIDQPVYEAALYVASGLMTTPYPAPRILSQGPNSVAFNWSNGTNDLYLTISADRISVLSSSPKRIELLWDYSLNQLPSPILLLPFIQLGHQGRAYPPTKAISDLPEFFDQPRYEIQTYPR